ncbi:uridine kinase [Gordonia amarae]|uniref:Uridine kinase n=1 Tax=Gordonia amarae TaxID=36821 RepID=A0A857MLG0_9ACTN|nr:uridine kinase [Gordonia amarae]QHN18116.1 uridine kinase [Gordonia amarae]QHN22637.1 uridine kinase [Gordonia amarae]QHN31503.1 uridine kinase [Gordonia amarae]QHN40247.1 uridine kinase [Gordonia amarae]
MANGHNHVLRAIAAELAVSTADHPWRVGIDSICGAGKSTFARSLVAAVRDQGRSAVRVDSDGFHHVRARRRRLQDIDSARGYYEDAYDFGSLASKVLRPLGPGGDRRYATKVHDLVTDEIVTGQAPAIAPTDAVMIFDATFIQRPELDGLWDDVVYLHAEESVALDRGIARDAANLGGVNRARQAYERRYMAACRIYVDERNPAARASIVVDNTDPMLPQMVRMRSR